MGEGASAGPVLDSAFLDSEFRLLNSLISPAPERR
jgi:hypothetical protein